MYDDRWRDPAFYTALFLFLLAGAVFIYAVIDWLSLPVA